MDISGKYRFYCGTQRGVLESTNCSPNEKITFRVSNERSEITALGWGRTENEIIIGYKSGVVNLYDASLEKHTPTTINKTAGGGSITGVGSLDKSLIIANQEGVITIWNNKKSKDYFNTEIQDTSTLDCMVHHKVRKNVVATGGEQNDFKLWNIETHQSIFKAKSMGHDHLQLPIPTSIRGIAFLPEDEKISLCATKEGHVLLYDERAQRRPVVKYAEPRASYTCIATAYRERQCLVGTTKGYMELLDMKMPGKCLKTFKSFIGSITDIICDPSAPLVASVSLDRYLRVHDIETKALVYKAYLKQNLTKILMKPLVQAEKVEDVTEQVEDEYEEIFSTMEVITDKKTKRKSQPTDETKRKKKKQIT